MGELIDRHGDQAGIHTHEDGLIHIHPSRDETAGPNAVLALFLAKVDLDLNDERLVLPDGTARSNGDQCSSGPGRLAVYQWAPSPAGDATAEVVTTDLDQVPLRDNHALALVFAPEDADIPPPPSVYALDTMGDIGPSAPHQASPELAPGGGATRGPLPNRVTETADTVKTADVDTQRPALPVGGRAPPALASRTPRQTPRNGKGGARNPRPALMISAAGGVHPTMGAQRQARAAGSQKQLADLPDNSMTSPCITHCCLTELYTDRSEPSRKKASLLPFILILMPFRCTGLLPWKAR